MSTVLKGEAAGRGPRRIGPADHGRPMTLNEFMAGDYAEGYQYELIDGKLHVSPEANLPEYRIERWLDLKLARYADDHPAVINYVACKARVFVPGRAGVTNPQPDVAAYRKFPLRRPLDQVDWQDVSPVLVVEVLSADDPDKDLVRNAALYLQVPSIREYWVVDTTREGPNRPWLLAHRRYRGQWRASEFAPGDTYTTRLLPDIELVLDPST